MLKRNWSLLALTPLLVLPFGANAAQTHDPSSPPAITVEAGHETVGQWSQRIGQHLSAALVYPMMAGRDDYAEGLAKVSFHCSENGQPDGVTVMSSSGSVFLDHAAMRAVKRMGTLHPLPDGIGADRPFQAWIAFAQDADSLKRMVGSAHRQADQMNARVEQDRAGHRLASNAMPVVIAAN